ncbi:MAG: hypothetical protein CMM01_08190 [Rhodopirellula sp.]|nr:hypothetical protein [Rhodopirellula sp.]MAI70872.1 hypothetical protein [Rhodopirellula sp.]OUX51899.1 MAG: hypothetical protein CBE43_02395 [Rhodopirellula sp. TMED283]
MDSLRWASTAITRNEMEPPSPVTGSSDLDEQNSFSETDVKHIRTIPNQGSLPPLRTVRHLMTGKLSTSS